MGRHDKDIPSTSRSATCAFMPDGETKCGKEAHNVFQGTVEVMGKLINIKKMMCDDCYKAVVPELKVSISDA